MKDTPIPSPKTDDKGKVIVPDILKYNSPITHTFVISLFLKNGPLNYYLNKYFNDINLRYLSREELFFFIKKCVQDFKIQRSHLMFYSRQPRVLLFEKLRERVPVFKNDDISLLCEMVENSANKTAIYDSLGIDTPKKTKVKKNKIIKEEKISYKNFLEKHFSTIKL
jgi:hypothetical protein